MIFRNRAGPTPEKALTSDTTETTRVERHSSERMAARLEASGSYRILRRLNIVSRGTGGRSKSQILNGAQAMCVVTTSSS
jgi:hypothetical protein